MSLAPGVAFCRPLFDALANFDRHVRLICRHVQGGCGVNVLFHLDQELAQHITADELVALPGITSLKELVLQCPSIKIKDIPSLTPLTQLETLDCVLMKLGNGGIERLTGLTNLKRLTIDATDLTDGAIAGLNSLVELRELEMVNGGFSGAGLKLLAFPNLEFL